MSDFLTETSSVKSQPEEARPEEPLEPGIELLPEGIPLLDKVYSLEPDMAFG